MSPEPPVCTGPAPPAVGRGINYADLREAKHHVPDLWWTVPIPICTRTHQTSPLTSNRHCVSSVHTLVCQYAVDARKRRLRLRSITSASVVWVRCVGCGAWRGACCVFSKVYFAHKILRSVARLSLESFQHTSRTFHRTLHLTVSVQPYTRHSTALRFCRDCICCVRR